MSGKFTLFSDDLLSTSNSMTNPITLRNYVSLTRANVGLSSIHYITNCHVRDEEFEINEIVDWFHKRGYISFKLNETYTIFRSDTDHIDTLVQMRRERHLYSVTITGDSTEGELIISWIKETFQQRGVDLKIASGIDGAGCIRYRKTFIPSDEGMLAKNSFYPWMSVPLDVYFNKFMESKESVLVLFGPPGTGKSTFLRSLIRSNNYPTTIAYDKDVITSSALITEFYDDDNSRLLVYEDIDNHIGSRENGNFLMSNFLNSAEGVITRPDKKVIFSTNLSSIERIDPALLRVGRCFDIIGFRELTQEEAGNVLVDMGREPKNFSRKKSWSLAEVLSEENICIQTINRFGVKTGFGR